MPNTGDCVINMGEDIAPDPYNGNSGDSVINMGEDTVPDLFLSVLYEKMFSVYEVYRRAGDHSLPTDSCGRFARRALNKCASYFTATGEGEREHLLDGDLEGGQAAAQSIAALVKGVPVHVRSQAPAWTFAAFVSAVIGGGTAYVYKDSGADAKAWLGDFFKPLQELIQISPSCANGLLALFFSAAISGSLFKQYSPSEKKLINQKSGISWYVGLSCVFGALFNLFPNVSLSFNSIKKHDAAHVAPLLIGAGCNILPGSFGVYNAGYFAYTNRQYIWEWLCCTVKKEQTVDVLRKQCLLAHLETEGHMLSVSSSWTANGLIDSFMIELKDNQAKETPEALAALLKKMLTINSENDILALHRTTAASPSIVVPVILSAWTIVKLYFAMAETLTAGESLGSAMWGKDTKTAQQCSTLLGVIFGIFNSIAATGLAIPSIQKITEKVNKLLSADQSIMFEEFTQNPLICVLAIGVAVFIGFFSGATTADLVHHHVGEKNAPWLEILLAIIAGTNSGLLINGFYMSKLFLGLIKAYQCSGWAPEKTQYQTNFIVAYREIMAIISQMTMEQYIKLTSTDGVIMSSVLELYTAYNNSEDPVYKGKLRLPA